MFHTHCFGGLPRFSVAGCLALLAGILVVLAGASCTPGASGDTVVGCPVTGVADKTATFLDAFTVVRAIPMETRAECLLRSIGQVKDCPEGLAIHDDARDQIHVFSPEGRWLRACVKAGEGPGEVPRQSLVGFCFSPQGDLFLASTRKWLLLREGQVLAEKRGVFHIRDGNFWGGRLFLVGSEELGKPFLWEVSLPQFDTRAVSGAVRFPPRSFFGPGNYCAAVADRLFVLSRNGLELLVLAGAGKPRAERWRPIFGVEAGWSGFFPTRTEPEATWHWTDIGRVGERYLYLSCFERGKKKPDGYLEFVRSVLFLLDVERRRGRILEVFESDDTFTRPDWGGPIGTWRGYLVLLCSDHESFNRAKHRYPALADVPFAVDDNPRLVLLRPREMNL